jgi:hypothetical protein
VPVEYLKQVSYVNSRFFWPAKITDAFVNQLLFTKFAHWSYEDEYRVWMTLEQQEDGAYFAPFSENIALKQVLVSRRGSNRGNSAVDYRQA